MFHPSLHLCELEYLPELRGMADSTSKSAQGCGPGLSAGSCHRDRARTVDRVRSPPARSAPSTPRLAPPDASPGSPECRCIPPRIAPMPRQPPDDAAIRARASRESFERGRDYWRHGAVSELIKRGNELTAEVQGSDITPYRVAVRFDDAGVVDARCTCPYDWGGFCKHIVAALLKLAHEPGAVE